MTPNKMLNISSIAAEVEAEVLRATRLHAPMNSPHEAHSVIEEEFDEFWDEVKTVQSSQGSRHPPCDAGGTHPVGCDGDPSHHGRDR